MHSMSKLVTLLLLTALAQQVVGWTQQYGDSRSSSYLLFSGPTPSGGWNYTTEPFVSETSPSVSADGTIFYPLRANVVAVAVNGSQVWKADVAPNGEAYLTNTVFWDGLVLVGSSWVQQTTFFQVVALRADDGVVMWKSVQNDLFHATTISISDTASAVYLAGYDQSTLSALRLSDGSVLWKKKNIYQVGIFMQTKVGPVKAKSGQKLSNSEIVILPTDPYDGFEGNGTLIAYDVAGSGAEVWRRNAGFSAGGLFAFSHQGLVYGSIGGGGGAQGQQIFGIDASGGELVFSNAGYCDSGSQFSGPAVDLEGYAYYSCGNQVFSINANGNLRWKSKIVAPPSLGSTPSPSLHPKGIVYFIYSNATASFITSLSTKDGSRIKEYSVVQLGYLEPPIIVGDSFMYLVGFLGSAIQMYPLLL